MDLKQIQELIRFVAKAGVSEVQLEQDDFKIVIKTGKGEVITTVPAPAATYQTVPNVPVVPVTVAQPESKAPAAPAGGKAEEEKFETIKSPMIGTFYRRPGPDKEAYVKVGDTVTKGQVVCVIEAMKLFNEIESDIAGKVVKILVEDSSPVEYDQPLFLVDPS